MRELPRRPEPLPRLDDLDTDALLKLPIETWIQIHRNELGPGDLGRSLLSIRKLIVRTPRSKSEINPIRYQWLTENGLTSIETVGDLVKVFQLAPEPRLSMKVAPWYQLGGTGGLEHIFLARDLLRKDRLLP